MNLKPMTIDRYLQFRLGPGPPPTLVMNMFIRSFTAPTLRAFWQYWNPGYGYYLLTYCYQPLRRVFPHPLAMLITFLLCGFLLHDILYLVPMLLSKAPSLPIPFMSCWFLIIGIGVALSEGLRIHFRGVRPLLRVPLHLGFLVFTFSLTFYISSLG